jgi:hypothetical protein
MASRCERSVGHAAGAVCTMVNDVNSPSSPVSISGRRVLTPAVSSHSADHAFRSRPDVSSSLPRRSASVVLPQAKVRKYCRMPARKSSRPTHAASSLSTEAPLA